MDDFGAMWASDWAVKIFDLMSQLDLMVQLEFDSQIWTDLAFFHCLVQIYIIFLHCRHKSPVASALWANGIRLMAHTQGPRVCDKMNQIWGHSWNFN